MHVACSSANHTAGAFALPRSAVCDCARTPRMPLLPLRSITAAGQKTALEEDRMRMERMLRGSEPSSPGLLLRLTNSHPTAPVHALSSTTRGWRLTARCERSAPAPSSRQAHSSAGGNPFWLGLWRCIGLCRSADAPSQTPHHACQVAEKGRGGRRSGQGARGKAAEEAGRAARPQRRRHCRHPAAVQGAAAAQPGAAGRLSAHHGRRARPRESRSAAALQRRTDLSAGAAGCS